MPPARPTSGGAFDEARVVRELTELETQISSPDFWKDQATAQKTLQRRRRLEDQRVLAESLRKQSDDLTVLLDWAKHGEDVSADLGPALERYTRDVQAAEIRTMLSGELDQKNAIVTIPDGRFRLRRNGPATVRWEIESAVQANG